MEDLSGDESGRVLTAVIRGYKLGTQAPDYVLMNFEYYPSRQAHESKQSQEITLRIERRYAVELGSALVKLASDPHMPFTEGKA